MKRRRFLSLLALVGFFALTVGCLGKEAPRGWAGPAQLGDLTIVSTREGRLDAIDPEGEHAWRFPNDWEISDGSADNLEGIYGTLLFGSYDGQDVVFVGNYNGFVYAFRPSDYEVGRTAPKVGFLELGDPVVGGLAFDAASDVLYATSGSRVFSLRASDLVRRIENRDAQVTFAELFVTGDDIWGEPVLADGKLLVASLDGSLYAVDPVTGQEIWRFESHQGLVSTPVVVGDLVLVGGFGSTLHAVDLASGNERWFYKANHWIWGKPAVDGDIAYIGDFDSLVHAIDLGSGREIWALDVAKDALRASPVLVSGTLVVSSDNGWLVGIDVASRSVAWERDLGTRLNADVTVLEGEVLLAPRGCVTPPDSDIKVYTYKVDPRNGVLSDTSAVC